MNRRPKNFGVKLFDLAKMKKFLPTKTFRAVTTAQSSDDISAKDMENFAKGVERWAILNGATRFTHWFQPQNGTSAGKRDSLFSVNGKGNATVKFRGKELQKGEGDASSFPNGGIRQTFEARGLTKWDCTSFAFLQDDCLCIPTTFCSFTGEALDKKTPLLRSQSALNIQALRLLKLLGTPANSVYSVTGAEQEYFLIEKRLFLQRPDLRLAGRTLVGCPAPKGQESADNYYSPPHPKIVNFWQEVDNELWKLGIVVKTEHPEVAPRQFELATCYAPSNLACDQNQIVMKTLQNVADKFGLVCLLHDKPFAGVNGSGKHNNWSLLTDGGENLFEMGSSPIEHARFLLFLACVVQSVDEHGDLLCFSASSAANDCRLGGFEAPPQTVSMFLGPLFDAAVTAIDDKNWQLGKDPLPQCHQSVDRNRTSPFAFTGNKFEFRAVGASASLADSTTVLNTVMAESLRYFADTLENSSNLWADAQQLLRVVFARHGKTVFNGNCYSQQWQKEAKLRNLATAANTPEAICCLSAPKNIRLFESLAVFSQRELLALQQICRENYCNTVLVEAATLGFMLVRQIAPAVENYLSAMLKTAQQKQTLQLPCGEELRRAKKLNSLHKKLLWQVKRLQKQIAACKLLPTIAEKARCACDELLPSMQKLREISDALEQLCPQDLWPLPCYEQLLF